MMKETSRFDLEQQILSCWNVVDDLKILSEFICDDPFFEGMKPEHVDKIMNLLCGMESMYQVKFDRCFRTFENCISE